MTGFLCLWSFTIHAFTALLLRLNLRVPSIWSKSGIHHLNISTSFFAHGWIEIPINNIWLLFLMLLFFLLIQFLNLSHFASFSSIWCICYNICFSLNLGHGFHESHLLTVLCFGDLLGWSCVPFFQHLLFDIDFFLGQVDVWSIISLLIFFEPCWNNCTIIFVCISTVWGFDGFLSELLSEHLLVI
mgnify:CR=1 FL=1